MSTPISRCRICGNTELRSVIDLGVQALTGVFPRTVSEPVPVEPLELVRCATSSGGCGLVQLRHSCDPGLMYGAGYGYRSGLNASMVRHLHGLAGEVTSRVTLSAGDLILDIGSNDGTLLRAMATPGVTLTGMDPSAGKFLEFYPLGSSVTCDKFSSAGFRKEYGDRKARIVTSIAMFYDLESPMQFMENVAEILADDGVWMFEQSYLPSMIENNSYDTICHEHLEYYCLTQIRYMAARTGLDIVDVTFNDCNGGSFRVTARHAGSRADSPDAVEAVLRSEAASGYDRSEVYARFRDRVLASRAELIRYLKDMKRAGRKVLGYGASTKGNVTLQYCGITPRELPAIAEVNPDKFGSFTPGTLIPIIPEKEARAERPDAFLVLPWHFRDFIIQKEQEFLRSGGQLVFPLPSLRAETMESRSEAVVE